MTKAQLDPMLLLTALLRRLLDTATEALQLQTGKPTPFATPSIVALDLKTMRARAYSTVRSALSFTNLSACGVSALEPRPSLETAPTLVRNA